MKALESRSQLLDAALESADQANRRWEEARQLIEGLRVENATLRAALATYQAQAGVVSGHPYASDPDGHVHVPPPHGMDGTTDDPNVPDDSQVVPEDPNDPGHKPDEDAS